MAHVLPSAIRLVMTCPMCPEQYDAYVGDQKVGYLRYRHGQFTVEFPDCGGEMVYEAELEGGFGVFADDERERYLLTAKDHLAAALARDNYAGLLPEAGA